MEEENKKQLAFIVTKLLEVVVKYAKTNDEVF